MAPIPSSSASAVMKIGGGGTNLKKKTNDVDIFLPY